MESARGFSVAPALLHLGCRLLLLLPGPEDLSCFTSSQPWWREPLRIPLCLRSRLKGRAQKEGMPGREALRKPREARTSKFMEEAEVSVRGGE